MSPKPRKKGREHWPLNLYQNTKEYWFYRRPDLPSSHPNKVIGIGKKHPETGDLITYQEAADVARQLNGLYGPGGPLVN